MQAITTIVLGYSQSRLPGLEFDARSQVWSAGS